MIESLALGFWRRRYSIVRGHLRDCVLARLAAAAYTHIPPLKTNVDGVIHSLLHLDLRLPQTDSDIATVNLVQLARKAYRIVVGNFAGFDVAEGRRQITLSTELSMGVFGVGRFYRERGIPPR